MLVPDFEEKYIKNKLKNVNLIKLFSQNSKFLERTIFSQTFFDENFLKISFRSEICIKFLSL
jgi:hypothetical protein